MTDKKRNDKTQELMKKLGIKESDIINSSEFRSKLVKLIADHASVRPDLLLTTLTVECMLLADALEIDRFSLFDAVDKTVPHVHDLLRGVETKEVSNEFDSASPNAVFVKTKSKLVH